MQKKKNPRSPTIKDYLNNYDSKTLVGALESLQGGFAWELFISFLKYRQREYEVAALDLACHSNTQAEAAKASGIACALDEVAEKYIPEFIDYVLGRNGVVENPPPQQ